MEWTKNLNLNCEFFFFLKEIIKHPNYTASTRYHDIALIRVSSSIPIHGDHIRPACLRSNMSDIDPSVQLIVTGWGKTSVESMFILIKKKRRFLNPKQNQNFRRRTIRYFAENKPYRRFTRSVQCITLRIQCKR